jgi:type VI secretion system ImpC/EvpB family protein
MNDDTSKPVGAGADAPEPPGVAVEHLYKACGLVGQFLHSASTTECVTKFLGEPDCQKALSLWIETRTIIHVPSTGSELLSLLERDIAEIDLLLCSQLDTILHHATFQKLEASWRGLYDLVGRVMVGPSVKIRVFSAEWSELARDLDRAIEFDQSSFFRKIYSDEFDMPGGEPFSVLVGDYEVHLHAHRNYPVGDIEVISSISRIAAAAFAPFIVGAHPSLFGLDHFGELERPMELERDFGDPAYAEWRRLRECEDARFLIMTLPRVLRREPYDIDVAGHCEFPYREDVSEPDSSGFLWGPAVYTYAGVLIRAFQRRGWLEDIRGAEREADGGGRVDELPTPAFRCDPTKISPRSSTDVNIDEELDRELRELGFLPLCHCPHTVSSAFHGVETLQKPARYDRDIATLNARLSARIPAILNVSRFAHYLKIIARDRIGSFHEPRELELILQRWLMRYVSANDDGGIDAVSSYPLREAKVTVRERPDKPGSFACILHLRPRFQDDVFTASLRLATELGSQMIA